jgi:hypothetical protein
MPDHARKQVRAAAVSDLAGLTTTGANVFNARVKPIREQDMPCLNVFLLDENSEWDVQGKLVRTGDLIVEGRAQGGDDLFDTLDQIAAEVETAIYAETPALSGLLHNIGTPRTQIELQDTQQGADRRTGIIRILFPVQYRTRQTYPTLSAAPTYYILGF